jgi:hypothetical protein
MAVWAPGGCRLGRRLGRSGRRLRRRGLAEGQAGRVEQRPALGQMRQGATERRSLEAENVDQLARRDAGEN